MAQRTNPQSMPRTVQTRFEPSHLASVCLANAYGRLVPVVRRALPMRDHVPGTVALHAADRAEHARHEHREERQQCL